MKKLITTLLLVLFTTNVFGLHLSKVDGVVGYKLDPGDVLVKTMEFGIIVKERNGSTWYLSKIKTSDPVVWAYIENAIYKEYYIRRRLDDLNSRDYISYSHMSHLLLETKLSIINYYSFTEKFLSYLKKPKTKAIFIHRCKID